MAPVNGSDTAPLWEVVRRAENGGLVKFFDALAQAQVVEQMVSKPVALCCLRQRRRVDVQIYGQAMTRWCVESN